MNIARFILLFVLVFFVHFSAHAAVSEFELLLDLDNNSTSGCSLATPDGTFDGVEKILVTTTDANTVLGTATRECIDPATNQFNAPVQTSAGGWPVGEGLGDGGSDVVETLLNLSLGTGPSPRVALVARSGGNDDSLAIGAGVGIPLSAPASIPGLGQLGMLLLAMLLALVAFRMLRRHPNVFGALLFVVLAGSGVRVAWAAFNLDGQIADWAGLAPLATDPQGDPQPDLVSLYGYVSGNQLFFRFDAFLNTGPSAVNDAYSVDEDSSLNIVAPGVLLNDSDANNDSMTVELVTAPANAQAFNLNTDGSFTYQPDADYFGSDSFSYRVFDGDEFSAQVAMVSLTVNPVNDLVSAVNDAGFGTDEDTPLTGAANLLTNDLAPDGGLVAVVSNTTSTQGAAVTIYADGTFDYNPTGVPALQALNPGESLLDSFSYTAQDTDGDTSTATASITVTGLDDVVTALNDTGFTTDEDTPLVAAGNLLGNDQAVDGGLAAVPATTTSALGAAVTIYANGSFDYDPSGSATLQALLAGQSVDDTFSYTARDVNNSTATANVTVTVAGVDDLVSAVNDTGFSTDEDTPLTAAGNLLANDIALDGGLAAGAASVSSNQGAAVTIYADGTFDYDPTVSATLQALLPGESLVDDFFYTAHDADGDTAVALVSISVSGLNEAPKVVASPMESFDVIGNTIFQFAASDSISFPSTFLAGNLLNNFTDPDSGPQALQVSLVLASVTPGAEVNLSASGVFFYEPPPGHPLATDTFDYQVSDGLDTITRTVTIQLKERVWYVQNNAAAGGDGRSTRPFDTLAEAEAASLPGDYIYIHFGDGTSNGQNAGIELKHQQKLYGEGYGLSIPVNLNGQGAPTSLVAATINKPLVTNNAGHGITVAASALNGARTGIEVRGLAINNVSGNGINISGSDGQAAGVTISNNTLVHSSSTDAILLSARVDASVVSNIINGGKSNIKGTDLSGTVTIANNNLSPVTGYSIRLTAADGSYSVSGNSITGTNLDDKAFTVISMSSTDSGVAPVVFDVKNNAIDINGGPIMFGMSVGTGLVNRQNVSATISGNSISLSTDTDPSGSSLGLHLVSGMTVSEIDAAVSGNIINVSSLFPGNIYGQTIHHHDRAISVSNENITVQGPTTVSLDTLILGQDIGVRGGVTTIEQNRIDVSGETPVACGSVCRVASSAQRVNRFLTAFDGGPQTVLNLTNNTISTAIDFNAMDIIGLSDSGLDLTVSGNSILSGYWGIAYSNTGRYDRVKVLNNTIVNVNNESISLFNAPCIEMAGNDTLQSATIRVRAPSTSQVGDVNDLAGLQANNTIGGGISIPEDAPSYLGAGNLCQPLP